jgi:hypothetical protein
MRARRMIFSGVAAIATLAAAAPAHAAPLAAGRLLDAHGHPAAGRVVAYGWPVRSGTHRLPRIGSATAGADGRYVVLAEHPGTVAALAGPDGSLDVLLSSRTAGGTGDTVVSTRVRRGAGGAAVAADSTSAAARIRTSDPWPGGARAAIPICGGPIGGNPDVTKLSAQNRPTVVGELNNAYRDTRSSFTYGRSADSDIGVAVAFVGGNFSIEGSTHVSNSSGARITHPARGPYAKLVLSSFTYGKYRLDYHPDSGRCKRQDKVRVRAERWNGGVYTQPSPGRTLRVCGRHAPPYYGGDEFQRDSSSAVTWSNGVTVFGIGLSVRSGFSRFVQTLFHFGGSRRKRHVLCGDGGLPATTAYRIFSGARS